MGFSRAFQLPGGGLVRGQLPCVLRFVLGTPMGGRGTTPEGPAKGQGRNALGPSPPQ